MKHPLVASALIFAGLLSHPLAAVAGAAEGKAVFGNQCASCHTIVVGKNGFGPSLAEVFGRSSGGLADYHYSTAMASAGLTWNETTLDQFLTSSTTEVPGTLMQVSIADAKTRADVIAYLKTLGAAPAATETTQSTSMTPLGTGPTGEELLGAANDREGWLYSSKNYMGQRYAASNQITGANAAHLRPVCLYRSTSVGATQSNPLVYRARCTSRSMRPLSPLMPQHASSAGSTPGNSRTAYCRRRIAGLR
ncbi:MAG: c-type cytochrome [Steroidobacteraceae bacterium]